MKYNYFMLTNPKKASVRRPKTVEDRNERLNSLHRNRGENLPAEGKKKRIEFVNALLCGHTPKQAAIHAGVPSNQASTKAKEWLTEPFVRMRFWRIREQMEEEQILSKNELGLNVKSIAFDPEAKNGDRINASSLLSKMFGYDAPQRVEHSYHQPTEIKLVGGSQTIENEDDSGNDSE